MMSRNEGSPRRAAAAPAPDQSRREVLRVRDECIVWLALTVWAAGGAGGGWRLLIPLIVWVFSWMWWAGRVNGRLLSNLLFLLGLVCAGFFYARHMLAFYVLFEISLLPTLAVILLYGYQPERVSSGLYFLLYTALSSLPLLYAVLRLPLASMWTWGVGALPLCTYLALTRAFIVKRPLYGAHLWLPKAHVEAPVAGSMALAGVLLKLGSYGLYLVMQRGVNTFALVYLVLSVWGRVACCLRCLRQGDLKSLIAYSSVVHIGVVTAGLVMGRELARSGALIIVVGHGLCSPCLFRYAYGLYCNVHRRLIVLGRGGRAHPLIVSILLLLVAINIGVPPSLNF